MVAVFLRTSNFLSSGEVLSLVHIRECTAVVGGWISTTPINHDVRGATDSPIFSRILYRSRPLYWGILFFACLSS